jgi:hypothetical protein
MYIVGSFGESQFNFNRVYNSRPIPIRRQRIDRPTLYVVTFLIYVDSLRQQLFFQIIKWYSICKRKMPTLPKQINKIMFVWNVTNLSERNDACIKYTCTYPIKKDELLP